MVRVNDQENRRLVRMSIRYLLVPCTFCPPTDSSAGNDPVSEARTIPYHIDSGSTFVLESFKFCEPRHPALGVHIQLIQPKVVVPPNAVL